MNSMQNNFRVYNFRNILYMERKNISSCEYRIYYRGMLKSGNLDLHAPPAVAPTSEVKLNTKRVRKNFLTL